MSRFAVLVLCLVLTLVLVGVQTARLKSSDPSMDSMESMESMDSMDSNVNNGSPQPQPIDSKHLKELDREFRFMIEDSVFKKYSDFYGYISSIYSGTNEHIACKCLIFNLLDRPIVCIKQISSVYAINSMALKLIAA